MMLWRKVQEAGQDVAKTMGGASKSKDFLFIDE